jgi:hypothetical protein
MSNQFLQSDVFIQQIENKLIFAFDTEKFQKFNLSSDLLKAIATVRSELLALITDIRFKHLSEDEIETELKKIALAFEPALLENFAVSQLDAFINKIKSEQGKFTLTDALVHKRLVRQLYQKLSLPELTIFIF